MAQPDMGRFDGEQMRPLLRAVDPRASEDELCPACAAVGFRQVGNSVASSAFSPIGGQLDCQQATVSVASSAGRSAGDSVGPPAGAKTGAVSGGANEMDAALVGGIRTVADLERAARTLLAGGGEVGTAVVRFCRDLLRDLPAAGGECEAIARIGLLEDVKSTAAAGQARETVAFEEARRAREAAEGVPGEMRGRGIASEIALARRESPTRGSNALTVARILDADMPHARHALTAGGLSEWGTTVLVKEIVALPGPARSAVDRELADRYGKASIGRLTGEARALANQVDPASRLKRHRTAVGERRVTVRPAPDDMAYLSALLPVPQAFACKKSLRDAAATQAYSGETVARSGAQIEADLFVERLTGQARADAVPVELHVVMTDAAVFGTTRARAQSLEARRTAESVDVPTAPSGKARIAGGTEADVPPAPDAVARGDVRMTGCQEFEEAGQRDADNAPHRETDAAPHRDIDRALAPSSRAEEADAPYDSTGGEGLPVIDDDGRCADPRHASAWIPGYGPISAAIARDLLDPRHDHATGDAGNPGRTPDRDGEPRTAGSRRRLSRRNTWGFAHMPAGPEKDQDGRVRAPRASGERPSDTTMPSVGCAEPLGGLSGGQADPVPRTGGSTEPLDERVRPPGAPGRRGGSVEPPGGSAKTATASPERVFLRRVLLDPVTGDITAMDTRKRAFTGALRRALLLRDERCRTPWCGAPIAHIDHTVPFARGGHTNATNGTGLCARCNYVKENPGWNHDTAHVSGTCESGPASAPGMLTITTPTMHRYTSTPPPLLPQFRSCAPEGL